MGQGHVIRGWDLLFQQQLQLGERAVFTVPAALAYGKKGVGGVIPKGADLVFDIELLSIGNEYAPGFSVPEATAPKSKRQRPNARCECGSGKKVKNCPCGEQGARPNARCVCGSRKKAKNCPCGAQ